MLYIFSYHSIIHSSYKSTITQVYTQPSTNQNPLRTRTSKVAPEQKIPGACHPSHTGSFHFDFSCFKENGGQT